MNVIVKFLAHPKRLFDSKNNFAFVVLSKHRRRHNCFLSNEITDAILIVDYSTIANKEQINLFVKSTAHDRIHAGELPRMVARQTWSGRERSSHSR